MAGGMWPNCLGTVRKAGIRCPHHLVVGEGEFLTEVEQEEQEEEQEYSQHSMY